MHSPSHAFTLIRACFLSGCSHLHAHVCLHCHTLTYTHTVMCTLFITPSHNHTIMYVFTLTPSDTQTRSVVLSLTCTPFLGHTQNNSGSGTLPPPRSQSHHPPHTLHEHACSHSHNSIHSSAYSCTLSYTLTHMYTHNFKSPFLLNRINLKMGEAAPSYPWQESEEGGMWGWMWGGQA